MIASLVPDLRNPNVLRAWYIERSNQHADSAAICFELGWWDAARIYAYAADRCAKLAALT